ncbi:MAG: CPBP family intramembrane glutamic endopeptidase [Holophagaceae bacterium]
MTAAPRSSWQPDRSWADPLIALLALLALLAAGFTLRTRQQGARRPAERAGLQARLLEVALGGPKAFAGRPVAAKDWAKAEVQLKEPWDRALLLVLKAELEEAKAPVPGLDAVGVARLGPAGERFRRAYLAAYAGGPMPQPGERLELHRRLGGGYAADLLEARLLDREGGGQALRARARTALMTRLAGLGLLGLGVLTLAAAGLAVGIYLLVSRGKTTVPPLPAWTLSGRACALVLLGWFLAFFLSGSLAGLLLHPWPGLRWLALPLGYLLHAGFGIQLLCRAEGLTFGELWQRVAPGRAGRDLAWGGAFLALAVLLVILVALISNLVLRPEQSPQRDLQELLRSLSGWGPSLALFLTVAGLAPFFEELLFRGFLLPVVARQHRLAVALAFSALLFAAIHLQPTGLPVLATLGLVMGLAMRHTGSLRTPILVHACWNGGLFLLMRAFA